jgi:hypothetical protein
VTPPPTPPSTGLPKTPRAAAAADLLDALQILVLEYDALTAAERAAHLHRDADRITGHVARHLGIARRRLRPAVGSTAPDGPGSTHR